MWFSRTNFVYSKKFVQAGSCFSERLGGGDCIWLMGNNGRPSRSALWFGCLRKVTVFVQKAKTARFKVLREFFGTQETM